MHIPSLLTDFNRQLQEIEQSEWYTIKQSQKAIVMCRKTLSGLKKEVAKKGFDSIDHEIDFFKNTKQIPLSNLIYYLECYMFETQFPKIDKKEQQKFITKAKYKIQTFFYPSFRFCQLYRRRVYPFGYLVFYTTE